MSQKFNIYDTEAAHNEIGQAIHDAKRRFLDAHKKGVPLQGAAETFFAECKNVIDRAEIRLQTPEPVTTASASTTNAQPLDTDAIRQRAETLISNSETKHGDRCRLENFLEDEKWEALAGIVNAIERGEDYDQILIANDSRTLDEATINALCKELADHLEDSHLAGYLFLLVDHIVAASRHVLDAEGAAYTIRRVFIRHNAHAADEAADHLKAAALSSLREQEAPKGGAA